MRCREAQPQMDTSRMGRNSRRGHRAAGILAGAGGRLNQRRLAVLLLAVTLLAPALAGCNRKTEAPFRGTLSLWVAPAPGTAAAVDESQAGTVAAPITRAIDAFEQSHPGVKVDVTSFAWPELSARLDSAFTTSGWQDLVPDVTAVQAQARPDPAWLARGALEPLDATATQKAEGSFPFALDAFRESGTLYGIPAWTTVQALYLNLDLFQQRGVSAPAGGRWTYDEFAAAVSLLSFVRADGTPVSGLGVAVRAGYSEFWPLLYADGARPLSPDGRSFTLDSPAGLQSLSRLVSLKQGTGSPWLGTDQVPDLFRAFADPGQRTVAIVPWDSWALAELQHEAALNRTPMRLGLAAYPVGQGSGPVTIGQAGGFVAFKQSSATRRQAVMDLLAALAGSDVQTGLAALGALPARSSLTAASLFPDALHAQLAAMLATAELPPRAALWPKVEPPLVAEVAAALSGRKPPAQALSDARKQIDPILGVPAATP